jgi:hypothetical protein
MTKIQLAAKAVWNGLMLLFLGNILSLCRNVALVTEKIRWSYFVVFFCACLFLTLTFLFMRNLSLPLRLTGTNTIYFERGWRVFFIRVNRLVCVFVGLALLAIHQKALNSVGSLVVDFLPAVRDWFTLWVEGKVSFALEKTFIAVMHIFYPFGFLAFCGYLIFGADCFIRWQIRLFDKSITKEPCNE